MKTPYLPIANVIPEPGRSLLIRAANTHSPAEIDAAIIAVKKLFPQLFKKED